MSVPSVSDVTSLFKRVYGDLTDLTPTDQHLSKDIPFSQKQKVGESYLEAVVLTAESGITLSASTSAFTLNAPRAGVVEQSTVAPFISVLPSIVPWGVISRTAGGGAKAFFDATKYIVRNNLKSHEKFQEIMRLYGQSEDLLGRVDAFTATYRGVNFTDGNGVLDVDGTPVTFTGSVAAAEKLILLSPGQFAAGIWTGMEGVKVLQIDKQTNTVVAEGALVSVKSEIGVIEVDFTPQQAGVLPAGPTYKLAFEGMEGANDFLGVQKILDTQSGLLFGIDAGKYSLWQGAKSDLGQSKLTLGKFNTAVANMVNKGGMEGDLAVYVNPRSWSTLTSEEAALRMYDSSYKSKEAEEGFESLVYYSQNGKAIFKPHRMVKEGDAFALHLPVWSRSGSAEVSFTVPGMPHEIIFPLENQAGYAFRSYADQYVFCHAPSHNLYISGIDDESTT
jgi:hypothetical protein